MTTTVANLIAAPPVVVPATGPSAVDFTVIIPFHRPGVALRQTVQRLTEVLHAQNITFEIIAVSAGCIDGTVATLEELPHTRLIASRDIQDKGAALQAGFTASTGAWIGIVDVDGDTEIDPYEVVESLHLARDRHDLAARGPALVCRELVNV
ncbi:glycosyl transferase family 2 [Krasilnikovia cinnamomea]|uniref:Glycosyl transferase family 2 n=1 Tax=Krasilnikovia cinnamomea TaxID=349313 RepID=A0A4Q7ZEI1_9ACTN|nr:glycosyltransferase [Krasilnikovia cinnamomea]RZU48359.1 glycosyl transferase family 2 [Krasilnikovia cinnamomea]